MAEIKENNEYANIASNKFKMPNEEKKQCCGECTHFTSGFMSAFGACEYPLPIWAKTSGRMVSIVDGSDCNAYQSKEERENNEAIQD